MRSLPTLAGRLMAASMFIAPQAEAANRRPVADAGIDRTADLAMPVGLDGSHSHDSDGSVRKYRWRQIQGPKVKLARFKTATPVFTTPPRLKDGADAVTLVFKLTVTDDKRAKASDSVAVSVAPPPACIPPQVPENGACVSPVTECPAPLVVRDGICVSTAPVIECPSPQIRLNGACITPPPACELPLVARDGECISAEATPPFNDTGMVWCSDASVYGVGCSLSLYPGQDAEAGRDATHYNDGDGLAGFSFTKLGADGAALPPEAAEWSCVKDNVTGLVWEVKTGDGGPRDWKALYTNYGADRDPRGEYAGATDAEGLVRAVNAQGLCGAKDWRLPTLGELRGLVDYGIALPGPTIDPAYFPRTWSDLYWTGSGDGRNPDNAWAVFFNDGRVYDYERSSRYAVRLVHAAPRPTAYRISANGEEVADSATGLVWRRCVEGMQWDGTRCAGSPKYFMWYEALQYAGGGRTGWRVPNIKELSSLVDTDAAGGLALDASAFPDTPNEQFWTSSPYVLDAFYGWVVQSFYGYSYFTYLEDTGAVRMVRDGP